MQHAALIILCLLAPAAAVRGSIRGSSGLLTDMRPEVVSKLLGEVTHKWVVDFLGVLKNTTVESQALSEMEKSCFKVTKSIIAGSDGDEDRVAEYMKEVCTQPSASNGMCTEFASGIDAAMIGDANFNREKLSLDKFCSGFWNSKIKTAAEALKVQIDAEEKAAAEKKAQEEKESAEKKAQEEKEAAETKAAEDKAAAEKKAADEKAAAEKKAADEAKAAEEAKKKQEEDAAAAEAKREQESKAVEAMRLAAKNKTETLTAAITKAAQLQEEHYNATEESVSQLLEHAKQAIKLAAKKEAALAQQEKEDKEAAAAAKAAATKAEASNSTQQNNTVPTAVEVMTGMNLTKEEAAAKAAGDAIANKIAAKAEGANKTVSK